MITHIHHINFLVRDLEKAASAFTKLLGSAPVYEALPARGAMSARFKIGEVWLVLVSPVDETGVIAIQLEAQGEGLFLLSFGVDNIDKTLSEMTDLQSVGIQRKGLADWQVQDIEADYSLPTILQLCQQGFISK